jgi:hypothetical protein
MTPWARIHPIGLFRWAPPPWTLEGMPRPSRILPLVLLVPLLTLTGTTSAHADPVPAKGHAWPRCGSAPDTDGKYCIVSVTKDGAAVPPVDTGTPGTYDDPFVDRVSAGTVRFGLMRTTVTGSGSTSVVDVSPDHTWVYKVNIGDIRPVELYGNLRDAGLSFGGSASNGHTFTVTFRPAPVAWLTSGSCAVFGGCGDDTTVADTVYAGFATGFVTDDSGSGLTAAQISDRQGYLNVFNAQDAYWFYDGGHNSLVMRMANPHLKSPGVTATGSFQTRIPDAMLIDELNVPDPGALTAKSLTVVRTGSGSVPITLTRVKGAIDIRVKGITFSTPEYSIHPKPSAPGSPRWGSLKRVTRHHVKVSFRAPRANGGAPIQKYAARCRRGTGAWHTTTGTGSPITVGSVPTGKVSCRVRAHNHVGWGPWSASRSLG